MFTGIIAEQGHVLSVERDGDASATLRLHAPGSTEGLALGGSVAVNGVCLTATEINGTDFSVDVMGETLVRSTIGELAPGDAAKGTALDAKVDGTVYVLQPGALAAPAATATTPGATPAPGAPAAAAPTTPTAGASQ